MPTLQFILIRRVSFSGEVWDVSLEPGLNLLIGQENTSKTTTLRVADFCLGDGDPASARFGAAISGEYARFELHLLINGASHALVRRTSERGQTTLTEVDGELLDTQAFNLWIAQQLQWGSPIMIPRGRVFATATQEDPLTFRALYRHIYRRADSWTTFASQEQEYLRRAVVAFFLGVAPEVYAGRHVKITQTEQELHTLEAERIQLRNTLDQIVRQAAEGFRRTGTTGLDSIGDALADVNAQIDEARQVYDQMIASMRGEPKYDTQIDEQLGALHQQIRALAAEESEVTETLASQERLVSTLDGDLQRVARARAATVAFSTIMVTACPACHQPIAPPSENETGERHCYVCHQPVGDDVRERRLTLEERALHNEKAELEDVERDLTQRLEAIVQKRQALTVEREALRARADEERRVFVTPLLQSLQRAQYQLGQLEQRRESLNRLGQLQQYIEQIDARQRSVDERLGELRREVLSQPSDTGLITSRTTRFASLMNEFIDQLGSPEGVGGLISLSDSDFGFYVGRERWENALGNERRVLFLLAYHYAYLRLATEQAIPHPGLAVLDNPFQQDVNPALIQNALGVLAKLCEGQDGIQVIVATRRSLPDLLAHRVTFERVFNPDGEPLAG